MIYYVSGRMLNSTLFTQALINVIISLLHVIFTVLCCLLKLAHAHHFGSFVLLHNILSNKAPVTMKGHHIKMSMGVSSWQTLMQIKKRQNIGTHWDGWW